MARRVFQADGRHRRLYRDGGPAGHVGLSTVRRGAAVAMAGRTDRLEPDAARQGTPDPGASGLARRRQALGNRWPGRQSGHHGRHGPPGDRRRRPRGGFQAGQRA
ncbi:hypothetical protein G6F35_017653 [Rhizopus arrhizus]|nr:hypothetical protein G6F24_018458 [Rhizopus arrhizus]KAG1167684.1 hypothetical protein G6F35_017653 [Rhizopus arrhizus]